MVVREHGWSQSPRKVYADERQLGRGVGPFVEVVDRRWTATLEAAAPLTGLALLVTPAGLTWVKANPAEIGVELGLSLASRRGGPGRPSRRSFTARSCPGVAVENAGELFAARAPASGACATGRPFLVAEVNGAVFAIVGHCRLNLAVLFGADRAERLRLAYEAETGRRVSPWWDLHALASYGDAWRTIQVDGRAAVDTEGDDGAVEEVIAATLRRL